VLDFILIRAIFILILGLSAGYLRPGGEPFWLSALMGAAIGALAIVLERRVERLSLKRMIGVAVGVVAGLVCAALVSMVLGRVGGGESSDVIHFAQMVCLLLFAYVGAVTGAAKGELLNLAALGGLFGSEAEVRTNQKPDFWMAFWWCLNSCCTSCKWLPIRRIP
jgi:hypothetical protein